MPGLVGRPTISHTPTFMH